MSSEEKMLKGSAPYNDEQLYGEDEDSFGDYFDEDSDDMELQELEEEEKALLEEMDDSIVKETDTNRKKGDVQQYEHNSKAIAKSSTTVAVKGKVTKKEDDIGSDEEKEILKGIRDRIETKVRAEMKEELEGFKERIKAIDSENTPKRNPEATGEDGNGDEDTDPRIKEAMEKMHKLDRILKKKIKKERSVKRDRLLLERRMRDEISDLNHGASHYAEIRTNTERFLALAPPASHNEGIDIDKLEEEEDEELPPLFATQVDDATAMWNEGKAKDVTDNDIENLDLDESLHIDSNQSTERPRGKGSRAENKRTQHKKDFIKRNKELAADAGEMIAMTDDEKKRIKDLLQDVDSIPEMLEEENSGLEMHDNNPFQVSVVPGQGFRPDKVELKSLTDIDDRLKAIMPEDDFRSITNTSFSNTKSALSQPPLFSRVGMTTGVDLPEKFGERVLYENKEERELKARLDSIEAQLDSFKAHNDMELQNIQEEYGDGDDTDEEYNLNAEEYNFTEDEHTFNSETSNHLTDDQLDNLLNQCARDLSRMSWTEGDPTLDTPDLSARSVASSRQSLMERPPRLSEAQLQHLLSEAHFPLSSRLMCNMDDDQKMEESGKSESIKAETWKAISEANGENYDEKIATFEEFARGPQQAQSLSSSLIDASNNATTKQINGQNNIHRLDSATPTLPRINPTTSAWGSFSAEDDPSGKITPSIPNTYLSQSRESSTVESVKLPDINSNSFLIHASQGVKSNNGKSAESSLTRRSGDINNDFIESRGSINSLETDRSRSVESTHSNSKMQSNNVEFNFVPKPLND